MAKLDFPSSSGASADTEELARELLLEKPDRHLIEWLVKDHGADVTEALAIARLNEKDLLRNPQLRPLGLQKHLHRR